MTTYLRVMLLLLGALSLGLGVFMLSARRIPRWLPARMHRARWKPLGWSAVFLCAFTVANALPALLQAPAAVQGALILPALGFFAAALILSARSYQPRRAGR
ncbi:hypothetical protein [Nonomuraea candida]|uniref:hypothetical protein n=1 Tax=Nonomuraea candida TaxID=359159 RepID=UPI0005B910DB|nr:hypothetical protein [Nonomuraea candida]